LSSAELSIDISRLVSRARSGEAIDAASEGDALAARYPGLGMSPELIGKAIDRAASMMGVVLDGAVAPPGLTGVPADAGLNDGINAAPSPSMEPPAPDAQVFARRGHSAIKLQDPPTETAGDGCAASSSSIHVASGGLDRATAGLVGQGQADDLPRGPSVEGEPPALARPVAAMRRAFYGP
jgi:hypothetical protein